MIYYQILNTLFCKVLFQKFLLVAAGEKHEKLRRNPGYYGLLYEGFTGGSCALIHPVDEKEEQNWEDEEKEEKEEEGRE